MGVGGRPRLCSVPSACLGGPGAHRHHPAHPFPLHHRKTSFTSSAGVDSFCDSASRHLKPVEGGGCCARRTVLRVLSVLSAAGRNTRRSPPRFPSATAVDRRELAGPVGQLEGAAPHGSSGASLQESRAPFLSTPSRGAQLGACAPRPVPWALGRGHGTGNRPRTAGHLCRALSANCGCFPAVTGLPSPSPGAWLDASVVRR